MRGDTNDGEVSELLLAIEMSHAVVLNYRIDSAERRGDAGDSVSGEDAGTRGPHGS